MNARAAIYARFSSDLQRDRSIEDQVALCREYAVRNGYNVVVVFSDRAITGSSFLLRRGIQDLLKAARAGGFDFVIAESPQSYCPRSGGCAGHPQAIGFRGGEDRHYGGRRCFATDAWPAHNYRQPVSR